MQELQRRFQAAIETMDEQDREIVLMRHFEQLSNGEVARLLEISDTAANNRYIRALKKLKGARFTTPSLLRVEIQPIGRGTTSAL